MLYLFINDLNFTLDKILQFAETEKTIDLKKLISNIKLIDSDIEREKSIGLDASLNERRILDEKKELLKTEKELFESEDRSNQDLSRSKAKLNELKT